MDPSVGQESVGLGIHRPHTRASETTSEHDDVDLKPEQAPGLLHTLLELIIAEAIPQQYENNKKWGTTKEFTRGWHVHTEGLKVETRRKKVPLNHGTWKRYRVTTIDPEETLRVRLRNPLTAEDGTMSTDLLIQARLLVESEMQEWQRGIRLWGVGADARADVELSIRLRASTSLEPSVITPTLVLHPVVETAELRMTSFKLLRLGKAEGVVIRELGDGIEPILDELIEQQNEKLADRLNRQIEKKKDKFRLSAGDSLQTLWSQWSKASE